MASARSSAILLLSCPDRPGIVSKITTYLFERGDNILRAEQSESVADGQFHLRVHFDAARDMEGLARFRAGFGPVADELQAEWCVYDAVSRSKIAILVSRQVHCLLDILSRWRVGDIRADVVGVFSNHIDGQDVAEAFGVPFHYMPLTPETKREQERKLDEAFTGLGVDLVVLARYMQVMSESFLKGWRQKVINIHHSFLPAFPGAKPYHQAMERGVKLIGATAHYATKDLDDGPIITQGVTSTSHRDTVDDLIRKGREVESRVLAEAVRAHLQRRVIVSGRRTILFE